MNKIQTFLWFDGNAEEAVAYYGSIFDGFEVKETLRYGPGMPYPEGHVMTIAFAFYGQDFVALNAGPGEPFTRATSFLINCDSQGEIDRLWDALLDGGEALACGWLTDRFGVTWQITPRALMEWIADEDPAKVQRVMASMMTMVKLDLAELRRAYEGD